MPLVIKEKKLYANICNETKDNLELQVNINYYKFDGSNFAKSKLVYKENSRISGFLIVKQANKRARRHIKINTTCKEIK